MAVINKETKREIAENLAKNKFDETIKGFDNEIGNILEKNHSLQTPKEVLDNHAKYPEYFDETGSISIYFCDIVKFVGDNPDMDRRWFSQYTLFTFIFNNPLPKNRSISTVEFLKRIDGEDGEKLKKLFIKFCKTYKEKDILLKKLHCLFEENSFTEKRLKNDFPEAYKEYIKIKGEPAKLKNTCDSIENIRATLK